MFSASLFSLPVLALLVRKPIYRFMEIKRDPFRAQGKAFNIGFTEAKEDILIRGDAHLTSLSFIMEWILIIC